MSSNTERLDRPLDVTITSMDRFTSIQLVGMLLIVLTCCKTGTSLTTEEQLEQLKENYEKIKEDLGAKVASLEAQVAILKRESPSNPALSATLRQTPPSGMPRSCADLMKRGHTFNGVYSVVGNKSVETVYCDFCKPVNDSGFQKWIGYVDVKSFPTYFYVQRNWYFSDVNTPILFEKEQLNVGGAYNSSTGKFTAPRTGKYFFSFVAMVVFPGNIQMAATEKYINLELYKNGRYVERTHFSGTSQAFQRDTVAMQSTLSLTKGDQIWVAIESISPQCYIWGAQINHFLGFLVEEELSLQ